MSHSGHRRLLTSLQDPDPAEWRGCANYSQGVAERLEHAYRLLRKAADCRENYLWVFAAVADVRAHTMSIHQCIQVQYVLAQAYAGEEEFQASLDCLDIALDLADDLDLQPAKVELAYLAGAACAQLTFVEAAYAYYTCGLHTIRVLAADGDPADATFEVDLLHGLAAAAFELGQYVAANQHCSEARDLLATCGSIDSVQAATVTWIEAVLARWSGEPTVGLTSSIAAVDYFTMSGRQGSASRLSIIAADCALDLAESYPGGPQHGGRATFRSIGQTYASRALRTARDLHDPIGVELARLALIRAKRVVGKYDGSLQAMEGALRVGNRWHDVPLIGRTYTAMGDSFASQGITDSALACYRKALDVLEEPDYRALSRWPHRGLLRSSEWSTP